MSLSDSAESNLLKALFHNAAWSDFVAAGAAGNLYVALHTADPGEAGVQTTSEVAFTGYARTAVARSSSAWSLSGTSPTQVANAAAVSFPQGPAAMTPQVATHFSIGRAASGTGEIVLSAALNQSLTISQGITATFDAGTLVARAD